VTRRQQRVDELLRREIAQMLIRGELRDPRLSPASAISITGVEVSGDLSVARVFVDVLTEEVRSKSVLAALRSASGLIRRKLGERLQMRRAPELRFEQDDSITRGARVEAILTEMREHGEFDETPPEAEPPEAEPPEPEPPEPDDGEA
jgi:ribosome-binding factor A